MSPEFPVYIVSKGRAESRLTMRALDALGVPFTTIVEAHEWDAYAAVLGARRVLALDPKFQDEYETCDELGRTKSLGPGPARNFAWEHARSIGAAWHWVMDDNIRHFYRFNRNRIMYATDGSLFRHMEDFCQRYANVSMAGPQYEFFVKHRFKIPPFILNTRIYSCNLIKTGAPFQWRGRYNEDTDLSLRILKAGSCTVQFHAFLQGKMRTQTMKGGNTAEFYAREGTSPKTEMLQRLHPDVTRTIWRFGRVHHFVDYRRFSANRLVRRAQTVCA